MLVCGLDIGAATAKAVVINDGHMVAYSVFPTGYSIQSAIDKVTEEVFKRAGLPPTKFDYVISTGYGRYAVTFSDKAVTEIICHARGAHFLLPGTRTIIDIGGQDSKVIGVDEDGNVSNFVMNDKCAAGTGRFVEVMAQILEIPLEEIGEASLNSQEPCQISSTCTIFAESEVVSLRAEGRERDDLIAGVHKSMASRVAIMGRSVGYRSDVVFTGGVAKNIGVKKFLKDIINLEIVVPEEPQIVGALGAALIGETELSKQS